jgi:hypothetical protein
MLKVISDGRTYGAHLITTEAISSGKDFFRIAQYRIRSEPTYQTIQIGPGTHIDGLVELTYMNHSCRPNVVVHTGDLACYAVRDIAAGEELTFFYPSTEWDMARPFVCLCGAPECIQLVVGSRFLSLSVLTRYFINQHISELIRENLSRVATQAEGQFVARIKEVSASGL